MDHIELVWTITTRWARAPNIAHPTPNNDTRTNNQIKPTGGFQYYTNGTAPPPSNPLPPFPPINKNKHHTSTNIPKTQRTNNQIKSNQHREFQYYTNNRTNSFVEDGVLFLQPTLTENTIGEANVRAFALALVWLLFDSYHFTLFRKGWGLALFIPPLCSCDPALRLWNEPANRPSLPSHSCTHHPTHI